MIGHYLLTLCPEAESDVLTGKMRPGDYGTEVERCLVGWAADVVEDYVFGEASGVYHPFYGIGRRRYTHTIWLGQQPGTESVEDRYDDLCERFGTERVNRAIRNRILTNQARRALRQSPVFSQQKAA